MEKYTLLVPVKGAGRTITEVSMRRLTAGDLLSVERMTKDAGETEKSLHMIARACGLDVGSEVEKMDLADINALGDLLKKALETPPPGARTRQS